MANIDNIIEELKNIDSKELFESAPDANTLRARDIRKGVPPLINPDGRPSTHRMTSGEVDGKFIAFPTLFPGYDTGELSAEFSQPVIKKWGDLGTPEGIFPEEAYQEAKKRDEIFYFDTEEESQRFAEGGWKP